SGDRHGRQRQAADGARGGAQSSMEPSQVVNAAHTRGGQQRKGSGQPEGGTDSRASDDGTGEPSENQVRIQSEGCDDGGDAEAELEPEAGTVQPAPVPTEPVLVDLTAPARWAPGGAA